MQDVIIILFTGGSRANIQPVEYESLEFTSLCNSTNFKSKANTNISSLLNPPCEILYNHITLSSTFALYNDVRINRHLQLI